MKAPAVFSPRAMLVWVAAFALGIYLLAFGGSAACCSFGRMRRRRKEWVTS